MRGLNWFGGVTQPWLWFVTRRFLGQCHFMKYTGTVKEGVVVFETTPPLSDGTVVTVEPVREPKGELAKRLMKFAGTIKDLPADMARNHDHYLHGKPKR
jgi:hypothetical protein